MFASGAGRGYCFGIYAECAYLHTVKTEHIMSTEKKSWVKDLLVAFAATTLSIILTFGTTAIVNRVKQKQERKLTALMVMGSIESFARQLEDLEKDTAHRDSIATWLLSIPIEDIVKYDEQLFFEAIYEAIDLSAITYDKTAETIFSSNIDTWKNMGNFRFINNVGNCFSEMNIIKDHHNDSVLELNAVFSNISFHKGDYPGSTTAEKCLRNEDARAQLNSLRSFRVWLNFCIAELRMNNRNNMRYIGISEKEVMDFTDDLGAAEEYENADFDKSGFLMPEIETESLSTLSYARQLDSLRQVKKGGGK